MMEFSREIAVLQSAFSLANQVQYSVTTNKSYKLILLKMYSFSLHG